MNDSVLLVRLLNGHGKCQTETSCLTRKDITAHVSLLYPRFPKAGGMIRPAQSSLCPTTKSVSTIKFHPLVAHFEKRLSQRLTMPLEGLDYSEVLSPQENKLAVMSKSSSFKNYQRKQAEPSDSPQPSVAVKRCAPTATGRRSKGAAFFFNVLAIGACIALLSAGNTPASSKITDVAPGPDDIVPRPDPRIAYFLSREDAEFFSQENAETYRGKQKKPALIQNHPLTPHRRVLQVKQGDGLMKTLLDGEILPEDAQVIIAAIDTHYNLRKIPAGQSVEMTFHPNSRKNAAGFDAPESVVLDIGGGRYLRASRTRTGDWSAEIRVRTLKVRESYASGRIDTSLFAAAREAELPASATTQFIRIFSHIVDFQRDIRRGDEFEVLYTQEFDHQGNVTDNDPRLLYLSLSVQGIQKQLWRHTDPETGIVDYFDSEGRSMKRLLMRTPIDGARLSSKYGMRKHPILGYSRMHRGIDFAAPTGTPIYASGNGVVVRIGSENGYGKLLRLSHANGYETLYAHLSKFANAVKKGSRVEQGQTIGYVGSTGLSTGPHLHYEVYLRGESLDPLGLDIPLGRMLEGTEMDAFQKERIRLERLVFRTANAMTSPLPPTGVVYR